MGQVVSLWTGFVRPQYSVANAVGRLKGKAAIRMNAFKTGIDAQTEIITGEDSEAFERLTGQYYDRSQPQGPEEVALIDDAISSDWFLRRLHKTEAQLWDRHHRTYRR